MRRHRGAGRMGSRSTPPTRQAGADAVRADRTPRAGVQRIVSSSSNSGGTRLSTAAFSRHSSYSPAALESQTIPLPTPNDSRCRRRSTTRRANRDVELGVASGRDIADRPGVDPARLRLQVRQDFHRSDLRGARHRRRRMQRGHDLRRGLRRFRPSPATSSARRSGIVRRVNSSGTETESRPGHAAEVVAHHVDDHHVLGAFLRRCAQPIALGWNPLGASGRAGRCPSSGES